MKIRTDKLTRADIVAAVNGAGAARVAELTEGRARSHARRFELYLEGSSRYAPNRRSDTGGKAATWDEWGIAIAAMYAIDPRAIIGHYTSRQDFRNKTREDAQRIAAHVDADSYEARTHRAPWLEG